MWLDPIGQVGIGSRAEKPPVGFVRQELIYKPLLEQHGNADIVVTSERLPGCIN
jgi:hypothetical protein